MSSFSGPQVLFHHYSRSLVTPNLTDQFFELQSDPLWKDFMRDVEQTSEEQDFDIINGLPEGELQDPSEDCFEEDANLFSD
jgi:hypothetical protein